MPIDEEQYKNREEIRRIIREELQNFLSTDRYTFQKHIQIFDGRNIQLGRTTGTNIGTATDQKIGFWNVIPVDQPATVADATDAASVILRCNDVIARLKELGLIASS